MTDQGWDYTWCLQCRVFMRHVLFALCGHCTEGMTVREAGLLQRELLAARPKYPLHAFAPQTSAPAPAAPGPESRP